VIRKNQTTTLEDQYSGRNYTETETWNTGYSIEFRGGSGEPGIPVCTRAFDSFWSCDSGKCKKIGTNYANCSLGYKTASNRFNISLLGEGWLITGMVPSANNLTNENQTANGGAIKLGKEKTGGILNRILGTSENLTFNGNTLIFEDKEAYGENVRLFFSVFDPNNQLTVQNKTTPIGESSKFKSNGKDYILHIWKMSPICPGIGFWVDISIFSEEVTLEHNKAIELNNETWSVSLEWKNKGASVNDTQPDHLYSINLCRIPCNITNQSFIIQDKTNHKNYTADLSEEGNKLQIVFDPPIPENPDQTDDWNRSDRHRLILNIFEEEWVIAKLNSSTLRLAKEKENAVVYKYDSGKPIQAFNVSGKKIVLERMEGKGPEMFAYFCELENITCKNRFNLTEGDSKQFAQESLHLWRTAIWWPAWAHASVFTDTIELNTTYLEFEDPNQTALKSIIIPKNSSAYQKLFG
jgi:hypothetical protein